MSADTTNTALMDNAPVPANQVDAARIEHQRLRRRMLYGTWRGDLQGRMKTNLGGVRSEAIGEPDMSANPYEATSAAAAALFDRMPKIAQPDPGSRRAMVKFTTDAGLYPMMSRVQRDVIGMRELFLRCSTNKVGNRHEMVYSPAYADLVMPTADPMNPGRAIAIREWVHADHPQHEGRKLWVQHLWDISGEPVHQVLSEDGKTDLSDGFGLPKGGLRGDDYPAIRADNRPILPYATFHAAITGRLMDPYYRQELVQGNLNVGVLWTFFTHCVRAASWPQRWISGGQIAGVEAKGNIRRVVADPATILEILQDPAFDGQVSAGQWGSASDPKAVAEAIGLYEMRFTGYVDVGAEFWRQSSDPRSGVALTLDRSGKIEAQQRYGPVFKAPNAEVLSISAVLLNRANNAPLLAEDGWEVNPVQLAPPVEQRRADREEILEQLHEGLISKAEARAELRNEDLDEAESKLPDTPATPLVGIVSNVTEIVAQVSAGVVPRDAGIAMVARAYGITEAEATPLLGSAGKDFVPTPTT